MFKGLPILMVIAIAAITGFQVFWLRESYMKEKRNLEFRSNVVFKETVRKLQAKKLNLDRVFNDSTGKVKIQVMDGDFPLGFPGHPEEQLTNVLNDVTVRMSDSLRESMIDPETRPNILIKREGLPKDSLLRFSQRKGNVVISLSESFSRDSLKRGISFERKGPPGEFVRFLYNVDSLQD